jgi:hypothetical protein
MKSRKLRIDPFSFFALAALSAVLAVGWEEGASRTNTHLRDQWTSYSYIAWWFAGGFATLWVVTSLLGRWYDKRSGPSEPSSQYEEDPDRSPIGHQVNRIRYN